MTWGPSPRSLCWTLWLALVVVENVTWSIDSVPLLPVHLKKVDDVVQVKFTTIPGQTGPGGEVINKEWPTMSTVRVKYWPHNKYCNRSTIPPWVTDRSATLKPRTKQIEIMIRFWTIRISFYDSLTRFALLYMMQGISQMGTFDKTHGVVMTVSSYFPNLPRRLCRIIILTVFNRDLYCYGNSKRHKGIILLL